MEHTFGMRLIKETICRAERCAQYRRLPSSSDTWVTTSPNQSQKQTFKDLQITLDLLLQHKEASSSAEHTGGHLPCGQGCAVSAASHDYPGSNTGHKENRYLEAGGGWRVLEVGGSGGGLW